MTRRRAARRGADGPPGSGGPAGAGGDDALPPTLAAIVREALGQISWSRARELVTSGRVHVDGKRVTDPARRFEKGREIEIDPTARKLRKGVLEDERIVYADRHVVVVNKPAGLLTVRFDESDRDTLLDQTQALLRRRDGQKTSLGVVQRLDKNTTGLLVFARNLAAKKHLEQQLREHSVTRRYHAIAHGKVRGGTHDTLILRDRGDGLRGSWGAFRRGQGEPPPTARRSVTHVEALEPLAGATLVECRLETGRQHQIRIHLAEAGHPLVGETVYVREHEGPRLEAPRVMLHATALGFVHPRTGERVELEQKLPEDFERVLRALRPPREER